MTKIGTISWVDLTVPDAGGLRDFYRDVTGWESVGLDMGGYEDYCMNVAGTEQTVAGICHSRGNNAGLPQQWMIYINVADLDASLEKVRSGGG
ncbi:MAG TPA: VOC family protein, partial [Thermoanaerobaculia bacterium]